MLLSVIITTYNRSRMLKEAVLSTLRQDFPALEVIVVDDGSVDDTASVVAELSADSRYPISYLKKVNGGRASACNLGLAKAGGDIITFLDDDDRWGEDAFRNLSRFIGSGAEFLYCPAVEVTGDGREYLNYPVAAGNPAQVAREYFRFTNIRVGSLFVKREVFDRIGTFNEALRYNEDVDLLLRMTWRCKACYCSHPSSRIYQHGGNLSHHTAEVLRTLLQVYREFLGRNPDVAAVLGVEAEVRIGAIFNELVENLIASDRMGEAASAIGADPGQRINAAARLALALDSPAAFRAARRLAGAASLPLRLLERARRRLLQGEHRGRQPFVESNEQPAPQANGVGG